jgi:sugar/nucleoside kinase (ribokinase family)
MKKLPTIDYLVIGHASRDITQEGYAPGGTAIYSALAAQALGCQTAMLTSTAQDFFVEQLLPGVEVRNLTSQHSTTFENIYMPTGRQQTVHAFANTITIKDVPDQWQRAKIVHLGPIVSEIEPNIIKIFSNSLIGLTPQGWFRRWDDEGRVYPGEWSEMADVMPLAAAVILSMEDIPSEKTLEKIRRISKLVVLTEQSSGCTVFIRNEARSFAALAINEVNPTGAGDIFATAFLIRLHQTRGNPWEAAVFANKIAACSVEYDTLRDKFRAIRDFIRRDD